MNSEIRWHPYHPCFQCMLVYISNAKRNTMPVLAQMCTSGRCTERRRHHLLRATGACTGAETPSLLGRPDRREWHLLRSWEWRRTEHQMTPTRQRRAARERWKGACYPDVREKLPHGLVIIRRIISVDVHLSQHRCCRASENLSRLTRAFRSNLYLSTRKTPKEVG